MPILKRNAEGDRLCPACGQHMYRNSNTIEQYRCSDLLCGKTAVDSDRAQGDCSKANPKSDADRSREYRAREKAKKLLGKG